MSLRLPLAGLLRRYAGAVITITRIAPRDLDGDNLVGSAKAVRDGIADALGVDDRDARLTWVVVQRRGAPKEYACAIEVQPLD